jgi:hypothetical protein
MSQWDDMLKVRIAEELAAGRPLSCFLASMRSKARVLAAVDGGTGLRIRTGPVQTVVAWDRLSAAGKKSLALSVCRDDNASDHALAAFYLMLVGEDEKAHLTRAGALGETVRSCFTPEPEASSAPAQRQDAPVSHTTTDTAPPAAEAARFVAPENAGGSAVRGRVPMPSTRDQQRARGEVRKRHQSEFLSHDLYTLAALPQRLLSLAGTEDDAALRYAYLQEARKGAAARGDLATAMAATTQAVSFFEGLDSIARY